MDYLPDFLIGAVYGSISQLLLPSNNKVIGLVATLGGCKLISWNKGNDLDIFNVMTITGGFMVPVIISKCIEKYNKPKEVTLIDINPTFKEKLAVIKPLMRPVVIGCSSAGLIYILNKYVNSRIDFYNNQQILNKDNLILQSNMFNYRKTIDNMKIQQQALRLLFDYMVFVFHNNSCINNSEKEVLTQIKKVFGVNGNMLSEINKICNKHYIISK